MSVLGNMENNLDWKKILRHKHHRCMSIQFFRHSEFLALTPCPGFDMSCLRINLQVSVLWTWFLKIFPFVWFHMFQHPNVMMSNAILLGRTRVAKMTSSYKEIPLFLSLRIDNQQSLAKVQPQKRCKTLASKFSLQKTHS